MCYSLKTSIISYTLGMVSGIFALFTKQLVLGSLIICYSQMQLSELMIWYGIDNNNIKINKYGTSFGKYLLASHNIAIGLGIILSLIFISKKSLKITDFIPFGLGIIFFLIIVFFVYLPKKYPSITLPLDPSCVDKKCQNQGNRLKWSYPHAWYFFSYIISIFILFVWVKPIQSKVVAGIIFTTTLLITMIIKPKVVGSLWCFSTAMLAPLLVIINYLLIRNKPDSMLLT